MKKPKKVTFVKQHDDKKSLEGPDAQEDEDDEDDESSSTSSSGTSATSMTTTVTSGEGSGEAEQVPASAANRKVSFHPKKSVYSVDGTSLSKNQEVTEKI
ncbi:hypothetical protein PoB_005961100 [Plakobranchus ocellatus]|uniref:Uncharacterized protein n=1 Tax=Plakobranchus ocellatus TaxID=259542 RepID=A0AAV4CMI7_9GAST|nr:hypothetical protein PoB_005961100 [Plakobranchus ocellatus]